MVGQAISVAGQTVHCGALPPRFCRGANPLCCPIHGRPRPDTTIRSKRPVFRGFSLEARLPYRISKRFRFGEGETECLPSSTSWRPADWR